MSCGSWAQECCTLEVFAVWRMDFKGDADSRASSWAHSRTRRIQYVTSACLYAVRLISSKEFTGKRRSKSWKYYIEAAGRMSLVVVIIPDIQSLVFKIGAFLPTHASPGIHTQLRLPNHAHSPCMLLSSACKLCRPTPLAEVELYTTSFAKFPPLSGRVA